MSIQPSSGQSRADDLVLRGLSGRATGLVRFLATLARQLQRRPRATTRPSFQPFGRHTVPSLPANHARRERRPRADTIWPQSGGRNCSSGEERQFLRARPGLDLGLAVLQAVRMSSVSFERLPSSPYTLGMVCEFVSRFPPFNAYEFGVMIKTLLYQLETGSHLIAGLDDRIVGYVGWIRTTREIAEAWLERDAKLEPAFEQIDAIAVTVLAAEDPQHMLPLVKHAKTLNAEYSVYWKRHFIDGRLAAKRAVRKKK